MTREEVEECLGSIECATALRNGSEDFQSTSKIQFNEGSKWECVVDNKPSLTLWRRSCFGTSYCYLSHSTHDIPLDEYFDFMMDLEGRANWDSSTVSARTVAGSNDSIVYHWEVQSPWPFSNRDYVCTRTFQKNVDATRTHVALSAASAHPECPERDQKGIVRVTRYRSCMALREVHANRCESFLLVVDDQKMNVPNSVLSWVASSAIPRFMKQMDVQCKRGRSQ